MLKEENNDYQRKSKQIFQNKHNDHSYGSHSQRTDEPNLNDLKANHTIPTNQIPSNNHSDHRHVNQLMPGSSSTNNSRTTPAQVETSTIVIPKTAIGQIIGRKGNKINKMQSQNNEEITISLTVSYYQDVKITGNANDINNALKEISEIVLCKNVSSNCCTYGTDWKFQHRNNIEIKNSQKPNKNIHLNITDGISNAEICNPTRQLDNKYMQPNS